MDELTTKTGLKLLEYGMAGVFIIALCVALWAMHKAHAAERGRWLKSLSEVLGELKTAINANTEATNSLGRQVSEIVGYLKGIGK